MKEEKWEMWAKITTLRPEPLVGEEVGADVDADGDDVGAELAPVLDIIGGEFSVYCGLEPMESGEKKDGGRIVKSLILTTRKDGKISKIETIKLIRGGALYMCHDKLSSCDNQLWGSWLW